ncbi:hypothetical protein M8J75_006734 [Diaphorina citri]|nr:hypothetical protein M8J75_006734 [Diaphorina citri]
MHIYLTLNFYFYCLFRFLRFLKNDKNPLWCFNKKDLLSFKSSIQTISLTPQVAPMESNPHPLRSLTTTVLLLSQVIADVMTTNVSLHWNSSQLVTRVTLSEKEIKEYEELF